MTVCLVTGGTGVLGRELVSDLRHRGADVHVLSRTGSAGSDGTWRGDLTTGEGIATALAGVNVVVHAATNPVRHKRVDVEGTAALVEAARQAGVRHLIYVSIVGVDVIPFPYYRSKLHAEHLIQDSGMGWSVLRSTQFHPKIARMADRLTRFPVGLLPAHARVQPVDVRDVAERLVAMVGADPVGRAPDIGGPGVLTAREAAQAYLDVTGRHPHLVELTFPGASWRAVRHGDNLAAGHDNGWRTYPDYLTEHVHRDGARVVADLPYAGRRH